jgi:hypothetical protein
VVRHFFLVPCALLCAAVFAQESGTASSGAESRDAMIAYSKNYLGTPYRAGGIDANGMDCSGFLFTVARESIGLQLPRTSAALYSMARIINDSEKEPGDIVFFRTVGSKISHAGLYLGNDQFIHSASDGPNTGVIISSLKESYWKRTYAGVGQILPSAKTTEKSGAPDSENRPASSDGGKTSSDSSGKAPPSAFFARTYIDASLSGDWTLFSAKRFMLISRGFQLTLHASYKPENWQLYPGIGVGFGWDIATGTYNIPFIASLSMDNGIRVYAGPVLAFPREATLPDTDTPIAPSIFPGILGVSWSSPPLRLGAAGVSFMQDIHYQVYNKPNGAALPFFESCAAGIVFSTGIRVRVSAGDL